MSRERASQAPGSDLTLAIGVINTCTRLPTGVRRLPASGAPAWL
jgi:hypothetical protein